ncbi:ROK family protein [Enterococcus mundtii]|uniref:Fructokinase n=1 Tax=Enterococcus mundtii TaxID=53346 RepID=A0A2S7RQM7_ENTMU|nr:ROK family protein [Enterococcus mundtii]PQF21886.1 fructokinase [Enterococcus mundtii]
MFGSIEAGGTKFVCAVATDDLEIVKRDSFPTTKPEETMKAVLEFFSPYKETLKGIGIGSFGPIDIQYESPTYGYITSTPKLDWQQFDFVGTVKKAFPIPVSWTTDVNAAAYGESVFGNGKGRSSIVYYTIGTGIGGGALQYGRFIEGFSHPEMGHMLVNRHSADTYEGNCPFHKNCLEGMASGPAIEKRAGKKGQDLSEKDVQWELEAYYLAQCAYNTTLMLSPDVIIFGGGVMKQRQVLEKMKSAFKELLKDYVEVPELDQYLVLPKLGDNAGTYGCLALAKEQQLHS